jgi:hypothetical protein
MWSTSREENKLQMSEKKSLSNLFEPKRYEVSDKPT